MRLATVLLTCYVYTYMLRNFLLMLSSLEKKVTENEKITLLGKEMVCTKRSPLFSLCQNILHPSLLTLLKYSKGTDKCIFYSYHWT